MRNYLSIIVGDCDHLKLVNDTYGHLAGDQYIVSCAKLMKETLPEKALIFRTGGDEFVAFLPDTPETETRSQLDALREGAKKYAVSNCTLSVSLGCSVMKRGDILARCIERADDQMYLDKQARHRSGG